ncbi:MAG: hypothetical protein LBH62_03555 [Nitrososphaerota archaeon]|jgi:N-acetylneuraminic acid mutarotase|nr:hypothetical protein [Nitrososphaerota archaeon]
MKKALISIMLLFILSSGLFTAVLNSSVSATDIVENSWNTKAPMNYPRHNFGIVTVDGKIYAIGGDQLSPMVSVTRVDFNERYDPKTNKWTILEPMPTPSMGFSTVANDGKIYCIGRELTQVYDIAANKWSTKTSYPSSNAPIGAHVVDGKIFVILSSINPSDGCEVYLYDHVSDSWTAKNRLPNEALIVTSFVMDKKLIVTGIFKAPNDAMDAKALVYDPNADKWSEWQTISKLFGSSVVVTSGIYAPQKLYIPQTLNRTAQYIDLAALDIDIFSQYNMTEINITELSTYTEVYDPVSNTWVNGTGVPTSRMTPGIVVVDDVLYIIGGVNHGESLTVNEQYIPFGYHGTLPSAWFSLDNTQFVSALVVAVVVVVVVVIVLVIFFVKNKRKQTKTILDNNASDFSSPRLT